MHEERWSHGRCCCEPACGALLGCFQDTAEVYEATWLQGEVSGTFGEVDSFFGGEIDISRAGENAVNTVFDSEICLL